MEPFIPRDGSFDVGDLELSIFLDWIVTVEVVRGRLSTVVWGHARIFSAPEEEERSDGELVVRFDIL